MSSDLESVLTTNNVKWIEVQLVVKTETMIELESELDELTKKLSTLDNKTKHDVET